MKKTHGAIQVVALLSAILVGQAAAGEELRTATFEHAFKVYVGDALVWDAKLPKGETSISHPVDGLLASIRCEASQGAVTECKQNGQAIPYLVFKTGVAAGGCRDVLFGEEKYLGWDVTTVGDTILNMPMVHVAGACLSVDEKDLGRIVDVGRLKGSSSMVEYRVLVE